MPHSGQNRSKESAELVNGPSGPLVPDHEVLRVIGRGAYGHVWLARHTRLGTLRAVKVVRRDDFGDDRPFRREFEGIQKYEPLSRSHPNLVSILHVGGVGDAFYYVMELADSMLVAADVRRLISLPQGEPTGKKSESPDVGCVPKTLRAELKQYGLLPIERCLEIGRGLASALAYLHQNGLVHRDVKPSNVIFVGGVAKLADIGLVAGADDSRSFVGTEGYIPPEGPGKPSADCYSLGKLLYELSTGHDRNAWPEPPADLATRPNRERLLELNAILHRACAPEPRQRYADASAMLADLELLNAGKSVKRRRSIQRGWSWAWKVGVAACLLALTVWLFQNERRRSAIVAQQNATPWEQAGTTNPAAWQAWQRALQMGNTYTPIGLSNAIQEWERSAELDPNYAAAWSALSVTLAIQVDEGYGAGTNVLPRAKFCAEKAVQLTPKSGFSSLANCILGLEYDFAKAETFYRKSIELNPKDWTAPNNFAWNLVNQGRFEEADQIFTRLIQERAQYGNAFVGMGYSRCLAGRLPEGLALFEEGIQLMPNRPLWFLLRGDILWAARQHQAGARDWLRQVELNGFACLDHESASAVLRQVLNERGPEAFLEKLIALLEERQNSGQFVSAFDLARLHAQAGRRAQALDKLERAVDERRAMTLGVKVNPAFDILRDEPRFHVVLRRLNLEK